jgi:hypothetical protein
MEKIMLNNYTFVLTEVNQYDITVEADSAEEAKELAWDRFNAGDVYPMNLNLDMERL